MKNDHLDHKNRPRKYGVTSDDLKAIHQRRIEAVAEQKAYADANLRRAAMAAKALRAHMDKG